MSDPAAPKGAHLSPSTQPCLLASDDVEQLVALTRAVAQTSGVDGRPRFHPDPGALAAGVVGPLIRRQIETALDQIGWRRVWGYCRDGVLVAQAELRGAQIATGLHRAHLGMSISADLQGQGVGPRLLSHVIGWARANGLAWIDLGVFTENEGAIRLYERMGFKRTGALEDVFRLPGGQVDDLRMSLDLRGAESGDVHTEAPPAVREHANLG